MLQRRPKAADANRPEVKGFCECKRRRIAHTATIVFVKIDSDQPIQKTKGWPATITETRAVPIIVEFVYGSIPCYSVYKSSVVAGKNYIQSCNKNNEE